MTRERNRQANQQNRIDIAAVLLISER